MPFKATEKKLSIDKKLEKKQQLYRKIKKKNKKTRKKTYSSYIYRVLKQVYYNIS